MKALQITPNQFLTFLKSENFKNLELKDYYLGSKFDIQTYSVNIYNPVCTQKLVLKILNANIKASGSEILKSEIFKILEPESAESVLQVLLLLELNATSLKNYILKDLRFSDFSINNLILKSWEFFQEHWNTGIIQHFEECLWDDRECPKLNPLENSLSFQINRFNLVLCSALKSQSNFSLDLKNFYENYLNHFHKNTYMSVISIDSFEFTNYFENEFDFKSLKTSISFLNLFINYQEENKFKITEFLKTQKNITINENFSFMLGVSLEKFDVIEDY